MAGRQARTGTYSIYESCTVPSDLRATRRRQSQSNPRFGWRLHAPTVVLAKKQVNDHGHVARRSGMVRMPALTDSQYLLLRVKFVFTEAPCWRIQRLL